MIGGEGRRERAVERLKFPQTSLLWTPLGQLKMSRIVIEVFSFQGTLLDSVLIKEMSLFQGCPYRGIPLKCLHTKSRLA